MVIVSALAVVVPSRIRAQTLKAKFRKIFDGHMIKTLPAGCRFPSGRDQEFMIATPISLPIIKDRPFFKSKVEKPMGESRNRTKMVGGFDAFSGLLDLRIHHIPGVKL